ncbi:MAG: hypothetical protein M5U07_09560 [Xanthobacteraceae bacterium]|nr:hypothetical protein [Xanthobacteraceae bacterium]PWB65329.1 MAG: hypothetical protein C3F17_04460 [Bradyrhizobiaceae bacterium]
MKKTLTALLAAVTIAGAAIATADDADARRRGGAVAAGIIGGIAAGAILGGAIANSPAYGYGPAPVYVAPGYGPGPGCYYARQRVWDEYYGVWRRQRVLVCP